MHRFSIQDVNYSKFVETTREWKSERNQEEMVD